MRPDYGEGPFKVGHQVELHPGCDLWMMGAKYGIITHVQQIEGGPEMVNVKMDHPQVRGQVSLPVDRIRHTTAQ